MELSFDLQPDGLIIFSMKAFLGVFQNLKYGTLKSEILSPYIVCDMKFLLFVSNFVSTIFVLW